MRSDIPADELERAQTRVNQLLDILRRAAEALPGDADSALLYTPGEQPQ